jgi:hypothetical protein
MTSELTQHNVANLKLTVSRKIQLIRYAKFALFIAKDLRGLLEGARFGAV